MTRVLVSSLAAIALLATIVPSAPAAFPGEDGRIAFFSGRRCDAGNCGDGGTLWTIGKHGGRPEKLVPGIDPRWSPDGRWIAYWVRSDNGSNQIFVMRPDGSARRQLTFGNSPALHPAWSPDGSQIVFAGNRDLWVVPIAGGTPERLTNDPAFVAHAPVWSPDGSTVAFMRCGVADWIFVRCSKPPAIALLDMTSGEVTELASRVTSSRSIRTGHPPQRSLS